MFLGRGTLNTNNKNYLVKIIGSNLIFLANIPTPDPLIQHLQRIFTSICFVCWYSGLTERKLPRKCIKSKEVYANKAWKIKCFISLHLQEDQQCKSFCTQAASLNSCDLFLAVLVYMQE